jgi:ABC-type multidrug transport system ATPase subunit
VKAALALRGVKKRYGRQEALRGLDLEIPKGVICGLVGPNGAGKTTAFGVVGGLVRADEGEIDILGTGPFDARVHRGLLGLLPQDSSLPPHLTVRQVLFHYGRLQGMSAADARREADARVDDVDLRDRADSRIATLSHGMRRRVQVAQALLGSPALVLLDEPTNGLDPHLVARMRELLAVQRGRRTLVVSSHVLSELEAICDHVAFIERGVAVAAGPIETFTHARARVRVALDAAPPIDALSKALPDIQFETIGNDLVCTGPPGWDAPRLNATILPVLLREGASIHAVASGDTLEDAYLRSRAAHRTG